MLWGVGITLWNSYALSANDTQSKPVESQSNGIYFKSRFENKTKPDLGSYSQCTTRSPSFELKNVPEFSILPAISQIKMEADSMPENSKKLTHLKGNVSVRDEKSLLKAEEVVVEHLTETIKASGGVSFESEEAFFSAQSLTKAGVDNQVHIDDAEFYLFSNHANGTADSITIDSKESLNLTQLSFSTCPINKPGWLLETDEMNINQQAGRGEAWHSVMRVGGVPVFYFPYINFPTDDRRKSGLLSPRIKYSDRNGYDVAQPVYWNIAPQMDATITPRLIEKRGEQLWTEFRWLTQRAESSINLEWMNEDKLFLSDNKKDRWLAQLKSETVFNPHWKLDLDAQRVSDSDYFRDFSSGLGGSNETRLSSQVALTYQDSIWQMKWFALTHQSLIGNESYRYLPSWLATADYLSDSGFRWQWTSDITRFEHKNSEQVEGERMSLLPGVSFPMRNLWGYLTPKLNYQLSRYKQTSLIESSEITTTRNVPIISLDSGIYLDRQLQIGGKDYTHTLAPRLFYTYIPYRNQDSINNFDTTQGDFGFSRLWQENRFTGVDRVGDTNQLSFALGNSLVDESSGNEIVRLSVGRIYYFADREVRLNPADEAETEQQSPWLTEVEYRLNSAFSLTGLIQWDEGSKQTQRAQTRINFEPKDNHIVNLTHRYRDVDGNFNEEIDFSFAWPLNDKWRLLGRWYNDLQREQVIERLVGVEYESCCWAIRLVAQKYLNTQLDSSGISTTLAGNERYNDGVYLQFVFKGLGSVGPSGMDDLLSSSITGYKDPFSRNR
ncbi:LPS-assembly protein LptD [Aliikangiella sp. IMCC44359]|uniref:LPS-assembly protein LptD n=1 Tax=Aliikangiella sp. IMCC44359 TaxID=3459125 RepID=UPI00403B35DE